MQNLLSLLQYDFMRHALVAAIIAAILAGIVGYFIMARQLAFAVHALGHISFTGACGAVLVGFSPLVGQSVITLLAGGCMGVLGNRLAKNDIVISVTLGLALGCGALFLHLYNAYAGEANVILFGNLLGVSVRDLKVMLGLTIIVLTGLAIIARPLWFMTIDPDLAEAKGVSLTIYNALFFLIIAMVVAVASQIAGVLLVFILIIGPPVVALQWSHRFWQGLLLSVMISLIVVISGLFLSYWNDWPVSFWISALIFCAYIVGRIRQAYFI